MQKPPLGDAATTLRKDYGIYHLTRLQADKEAKQLAAAFEQAQNRMKEKEDSLEAAYTAMQAAYAVRDSADDALDGIVKEFYGAIVTATQHNQKSPLFSRYFPDGMSKVVIAPLEEELQRVAAIIAKLGEETDQTLKGYTPVLAAGCDNLRAAMAAFKSAVDAHNKAREMVEAEKLNWLDAYVRSYRDLGRIFYKQPKKPDTFFKPVPKAKKGNGGAPTGDQSTPKPPATKA